MLASTARATRALFAPSPARGRGRRRADARAGLLDHWRLKSNENAAAATSATNGDGVVARDDAVASLERSMAQVASFPGSAGASARGSARDGADARECDVFVCPPAPFIADVARTVREMGDAG
tara:strand:+ start:3003 stop:3371 length:369 start_codon:yes stop_codon:yes gene_type:complete